MTALTNTRVEIDRDRYGRPLVVPPAGGKPVAYTRCTTYIDVLEDKFNLQKWMQRQVALGLSTRPDLQLSVVANRDDKRELDRICEAAREAAGSSAAATTGSSVHALTELPDRGQPLPDHLPPAVQASVEAYLAATRDLKATHIEQFCVLDTLKIGGTPDRIVKYDGGTYIADIKTGSIEWGALKIAMQMAVYARSHTYDIATGQRGVHGADARRAIIIHLPAGDDPAAAACTLHWVDIEAGWEAVKVARQVRDQRRLTFKQLCSEFGPITKPVDTTPEHHNLQQILNHPEDIPLQRLIKACVTAQQVRDLWAAHQDRWTDADTDTATAHIANLPTVA